MKVGDTEPGISSSNVKSVYDYIKVLWLTKIMNFQISIIFQLSSAAYEKNQTLNIYFGL